MLTPDESAAPLATMTVHQSGRSGGFMFGCLGYTAVVVGHVELYFPLDWSDLPYLQLVRLFYDLLVIVSWTNTAQLTAGDVTGL